MLGREEDLLELNDVRMVAAQPLIQDLSTCGLDAACTYTCTVRWACSFDCLCSSLGANGESMEPLPCGKAYCTA